MASPFPYRCDLCRREWFGKPSAVWTENGKPCASCFFCLAKRRRTVLSSDGRGFAFFEDGKKPRIKKVKPRHLQDWKGHTPIAGVR